MILFSNVDFSFVLQWFSLKMLFFIGFAMAWAGNVVVALVLQWFLLRMVFFHLFLYVFDAASVQGGGPLKGPLSLQVLKTHFARKRPQ